MLTAFVVGIAVTLFAAARADDIALHGAALVSVAAAFTSLTRLSTAWLTTYSTSIVPTSTTTGYCAWAGVTCDDSFLVTAIALSGRGLTGTIPSAISALSALTTLTSLDLHSNDLKGTLPSTISAVTSLSSLRLDFNSLTGTIPASVSALASLTKLDLHSNYFTGTVPDSLNTLSLSKYNFNLNLLTGTLPVWSVSSIDLTDDTATVVYTPFLQQGSIANITAEGYALCSMTRLGLAPMGWASCEGSNAASAQQYAADPYSWSSTSTYSAYSTCGPYNPPWCCSMWTGVACDSNYNVISIDISTSTSGLTLADQLPSTMGAFSALTSLDISGPGYILGSLPSSLATISTLQTVKAYSQRLSGTIPQFGALNTALVTLDLHANSFSGTLPVGLGNVGTSLAYLDVSSNKLVGSIPSTLSACTALTYLGFSTNSLNGPLPTWLGSLTSTTAMKITFDNNAFTGPYPSLANWPYSNNNQQTGIPIGLNPSSGTPADGSTSLLTFQNNFLTGYVPAIYNSTSGAQPSQVSATMTTYTTQRSTTASGSNAGVVLGGSQVRLSGYPTP